MFPSDLPNSKTGYVQRFTLPSTVTNVQWMTALKPLGVTMCHIVCIGGGAGGGGGFTGAAASARGGGGGGGSSAVTRVTIPAHFLPDALYIQVGAGGKGVGSGGGTAGSGILSYVTIYPHTSALNVVAVSGNAAAVGGGTGTAAAVGAAGTAGTIATIANMPLAGYGHFDLIAGHLGIAGGPVAGGSPTAQTIPATSIITMGGCGGAGTTNADFAGGSISATANTFLSQSRQAVAAAGSNNGSAGFLLEKPFFSFPGYGGSASNAGVGGAGGNGGPGSGGGGGGGGTTGGRGGDGGDGLVIITWW